MAMRTASPWWLSLCFGLGLLEILFGQRLFGHLPTIGGFQTVLGLIVVLGVTGLRGFTAFKTTGARRGVERTLLMCQLGVLLALFLYYLTTKSGMSHFSFTEKGAAKWDTVLTVIWAILMTASLVPMFTIEMSLGVALRAMFDLKTGGDEGGEDYRVS